MPEYSETLGVAMYITYSDPDTGAVFTMACSPMAEWSHSSLDELRVLGIGQALRSGIDVSAWIFNVEVD